MDVLEERPQLSYRCSRCQGQFEAADEPVVQCPFCAMLCEAAQCEVE